MGKTQSHGFRNNNGSNKGPFKIATDVRDKRNGHHTGFAYKSRNQMRRVKNMQSTDSGKQPRSELLLDNPPESTQAVIYSHMTSKTGQNFYPNSPLHQLLGKQSVSPYKKQQQAEFANFFTPIKNTHSYATGANEGHKNRSAANIRKKHYGEGIRAVKSGDPEQVQREDFPQIFIDKAANDDLSPDKSPEKLKRTMRTLSSPKTFNQANNINMLLQPQQFNQISVMGDKYQILSSAEDEHRPKTSAPSRKKDTISKIRTKSPEPYFAQGKSQSQNTTTTNINNDGSKDQPPKSIHESITKLLKQFKASSGTSGINLAPSSQNMAQTQIGSFIKKVPDIKEDYLFKQLEEFKQRQMENVKSQLQNYNNYSYVYPLPIQKNNQSSKDYTTSHLLKNKKSKQRLEFPGEDKNNTSVDNEQNLGSRKYSSENIQQTLNSNGQKGPNLPLNIRQSFQNTNESPEKVNNLSQQATQSPIKQQQQQLQSPLPPKQGVGSTRPFNTHARMRQYDQHIRKRLFQNGSATPSKSKGNLREKTPATPNRRKNMQNQELIAAAETSKTEGDEISDPRINNSFVQQQEMIQDTNCSLMTQTCYVNTVHLSKEQQEKQNQRPLAAQANSNSLKKFQSISNDDRMAKTTYVLPINPHAKKKTNSNFLDVPWKDHEQDDFMSPLDGGSSSGASTFRDYVEAAQ